MWILVAKQLVIMLIIALLGFAVSKAFHFGKTEQQCVSKLLLYFINPCLIISRFNLPFKADMLKSLGIVIGISLIIHFLMAAIAVLLIRSKTEEGKELDKLDRIGVVFTNCGFIGIPLINGVIGPEGVFYLLGYLVVFNVFLWTFGYVMVGEKMQLKKLVTNPNIIAVCAGLILFALPVTLPDLIAKPLKYIGDMNTATAMLLLGMLFASFKLNSNSNEELSEEDRKKNTWNVVFRVARLCLVRLVVMIPVSLAIVFAVSKLFSFLPDIRTICFVIYICSLTPVAMSVSSFAVLFKKDESYSGLLVMASSALCIVTLPAAIALAEKFI